MDRVRRYLLALAVGAVAFLVPTPPASAHSELVASTPAFGERVGGFVHIELVFSSGLTELAVVVEAPGGGNVDGELTTIAPQYHVFEASPATAEGQYIVRYSGVADDGDPVEGAYAFSVEAGAGEPAELPLDVSFLVEDDHGPSIWFYVTLMVGVVVVAVLTGALVEKLRRLRLQRRS